jgi:hypothetical protein
MACAGGGKRKTQMNTPYRRSDEHHYESPTKKHIKKMEESLRRQAGRELRAMGTLGAGKN